MKYWDILVGFFGEGESRATAREQLPEGSIGHLIDDDGDWLIGVAGEYAGVRVEIEALDMSLHCDESDGRYIACELGFVLGVWRDERREELTTTFRLYSHEEPDWLGLQASPASVSDVRDELSYMAEQIGENRLSSIAGTVNWPRLILAATQETPAEDSLLHWCSTTLCEALCAEPISLSVDGHDVALHFDEAFVTTKSLSSRGSGWVNLTLRQQGPRLWGESESVDQSSIGLESLSEDAIHLPAPTEAQHREIMRYVGVWRGHVHDFLYHYMVSHPSEAPSWGYFQWSYALPLNLLEVVEALVVQGTPPPMPVTAFASDAFAAAAPRLRRLTLEEEIALTGERRWRESLQWLFRLDERYTIGLRANPNRWAHAESEIYLWDDDYDESVQVLLTDVWCPQSRVCIDGDAFAFKRFTEWLAGVIRAADVDDVREFYEDEERPKLASKISASEWLTFGQPPLGDKHWLDWRAQNYVVFADAPIEHFAGMFGFSDEYLQRLPTDRSIWRRFLCDAIDPQFDYAISMPIYANTTSF